jgi:hypothetical protein
MSWVYGMRTRIWDHLGITRNTSNAKVDVEQRPGNRTAWWSMDIKCGSVSKSLCCLVNAWSLCSQYNFFLAVILLCHTTTMESHSPGNTAAPADPSKADTAPPSTPLRPPHDESPAQTTPSPVSDPWLQPPYIDKWKADQDSTKRNRRRTTEEHGKLGGIQWAVPSRFA